MTLGIIGKKIGMTQIFTENGEVIPVTVVKAGPCPIVQIKKKEKEGYNAIQLGFEEIPERKVNKPRMGHFKKAGVYPVRILREFRVDDIDKYKVGENIKVSIFEEKEKVDVTGTSKGKGFQGVVKRFGFRGFPASHGTHEYFRHPGSIGTRTFPGRVWKNKKMPGHEGCKRVTVRNLEVVKIIPEEHLILLKGAIPGPNGGYVLIKKSKINK